MSVTACDDRDPSTCDLLALPPPEVCTMAVRMLALHQAATELAIATLGAVLATAFCSDAAGADGPTVTMETPSAWREDQAKAQRRRTSTPCGDANAERSACAPPEHRSSIPRRNVPKKPAPHRRSPAALRKRLVVRRCRSPPRLLSRSSSLVKPSRGRRKKFDASFATNVTSLRPRLASLRDPEHRHQKPLPLSRLRRSGGAS